MSRIQFYIFSLLLPQIVCVGICATPYTSTAYPTMKQAGSRYQPQLAQEPVAAVGSMSVGAYPIYKGAHVRQRNVRSIGGSSLMTTSGGGQCSSGVSATGVGTSWGSVSNAGTIANAGNSGTIIGGSSLQLGMASAEQYIARAGKGSRLAPPNLHNGWDNALYELFYEAGAGAYTIDGIHYYNQAELERLWNQYLAEHGNNAPGQFGSGATWEDILNWLLSNTSGEKNNSRLPVGDGLLLLLLLAGVYAVKKRRQLPTWFSRLRDS